MDKIKTYKDLRVFQHSFKYAMEIFHLSKSFPIEERYALTSQVVRSSRSVCANLTEAWRKRKYEKYFMSKLTDCEGEAEETQLWLDFALSCGYINQETHKDLFEKYDHVISMLVRMMQNPDKWTFNLKKK
jgi:four helix bundle protein